MGPTDVVFVPVRELVRDAADGAGVKACGCAAVEQAAAAAAEALLEDGGAEVLGGGGAADDGRDVGARGDLEQEVHREEKRRRRRLVAFAEAFR